MGAIKKVFYSKKELYAIMRDEYMRGSLVCRIRGDVCKTLDSFFQEVSASLRFPYYFGWNWNAFDDCMTDLDWMKFSRILIVIDDYRTIFKDESSQVTQIELLLKHLCIVNDYWKTHNIDVDVFLNEDDSCR